MVTNQQIEEITSIIIDTVHPKKIYLIGSYANGKATEESDVDFLIISNDPDLPKFERTLEIQKRLFKFSNFPMDNLVFSESEVKSKIENQFSFIGHAIKNGKVIYNS